MIFKKSSRPIFNSCTPLVEERRIYFLDVNVFQKYSKIISKITKNIEPNNELNNPNGSLNI